MRVLHLYNVFGAPTERAWLNTALGVAAAGHEVVCACETVHAEAPAPEALPFEVVVRPRVVVKPGDLMEEVAAREPVVAGDFDLVHGHFGPRVLWASAYLKRGVRTVISLYGYDASRLLRDVSWIERYRWAAERGAIFVVLSEAMRSKMKRLGLPGESLRVVRLGIDLTSWVFDPDAAAGAAASGLEKRFVFVGRLTEKKAPLDAIAAARLAGVKLDVIGGGELEDQVRAAIGDDANVRLLGPRKPEEIRRIFRGASGLVLPSATASDGDEEGTPVVLMEAQAMGLPCVTTDHAGNAEVVPPAPGSRRFVVGEHDVAGLARAMREVCAMTSAERAEVVRAGRAWVEARHDVRGIVGEYLRVYEGGDARGKCGR
jgi:glycosyltransferase involved in cell wall biosynthesis